MKRALPAILGAALALEAAAAPAPKAKPEKPAEPQTRELRVLQKVMPAYDPSAGIADGGCVTVKFQIRHDGFVGEVTVLEARPEALAEPAIAAMKQWVFQSFPPPDLYGVQTFYFTPEQVRLPDSAIRGPYATLTDAGNVANTSCATGKGAAKREAKG